MMKKSVDISSELKFRTARSGGKGGQNVNKLETMVEAIFNIAESALLDEEQKNLLFEKIPNKINRSGQLLVRSQEGRTQWSNKKKAIGKINTLVNRSLRPKKKRKRTKPPAKVNEKRLQKKRQQAEKKQNRQKIRKNNI